MISRCVAASLLCASSAPLLVAPNSIVGPHTLLVGRIRCQLRAPGLSTLSAIAGEV